MVQQQARPSPSMAEAMKEAPREHTKSAQIFGIFGFLDFWIFFFFFFFFFFAHLVRVPVPVVNQRHLFFFFFFIFLFIYFIYFSPCGDMHLVF